MSQLFSEYRLRDIVLRNRTAVAPMCQYSAVHGVANDWHLVHLGRFALGGFGLVMVEATAVTPEGRISYADLGLWDDAQIPGLGRIAAFLKAEGSAAAIQLAHAGRKASSPVWWRNGFTETEEEKPVVGFENWQPVAPSPQRHSASPDYQTPAELDQAGIHRIIDGFAAATRRADAAGFDIVEIHGAHGYLVNQFLSPYANARTDQYGGSRENRMRFLLEITEAVRAVWPASKPLLVRLSITDRIDDGWNIEDSIILSGELIRRGVDLIDTTSGGFDRNNGSVAPLYQVPLAAAIRAAGYPSMAVGLITDPHDAEAIIARGDADLVALARGALDDPNWPVHARAVLDGNSSYDLWPKQAGARIRDLDRLLKRGG